MKIKTEQLARTLKANAHPVYWLSGDEPLLLQEAADQVRRYHRDAGFADREIHTVERNYKIKVIGSSFIKSIKTRTNAVKNAYLLIGK